jgi:HAD superfamily hydrolase (TIGR01509 family)
MALAAVIFDVDGTLIDSNDLHALAWQRAFERYGHPVPYERVRAHIGMGGDKLLPALLGDEVEAREGDAIRKRQGQELGTVLEDPKQPKRVFPEVVELLSALRERGLRTALATSAERNKLDDLERAFGIDLGRRVDEVVTASQVSESKPAPDVVCAALEVLSVGADAAVMVGDTPYDAKACRAAGVDFIGVRSGGWTDAELRAAGARITYADTGELCAHLDEALQRGQ